MGNQKLINQVAQEIVNEYPNGNISIDDVIERALEEVCFHEYSQDSHGATWEIYEKFLDDEDLISDVSDRVFDLLTD